MSDDTRRAPRTEAQGFDHQPEAAPAAELSEDALDAVAGGATWGASARSCGCSAIDGGCSCSSASSTW